jgi:hypothetical protein
MDQFTDIFALAPETPTADYPPVDEDTKIGNSGGYCIIA